MPTLVLTHIEVTTDFPQKADTKPCKKLQKKKFVSRPGIEPKKSAVRKFVTQYCVLSFLIEYFECR